MNFLKMTVKGKEVDFAPWINRVLLGVVAYFLIEANVKFNKVIDKLDAVFTQQAVNIRDIMETKALYEYQRGVIKELREDNTRQDQEILDLNKRINGK